MTRAAAERRNVDSPQGPALPGWATVLTLILGIMLAGGPVAASTPAEIAREVLSQSAYQHQLPAASLAETTVKIPTQEPVRLNLPDWLYQVAKLLIYGLLAVGAIGLAVYLWRFLVESSGRGETSTNGAAAAADGAMPAAAAGPTLREADALAEAGRFADAVHLLLGAALYFLRQRIAPGLADSLTSREVIDVVDMPEERRAALLGIVGTVEVSHFGDRPVDAGSYGRCRDFFATLTGSGAEPA